MNLTRKKYIQAKSYVPFICVLHEFWRVQILEINEQKFRIWKSDINDFNKWRSKNDVLTILNYISTHSESFREWLNFNKITIDDVVSVVPTRRIFVGNEHSQLFELNGNSYESYFYWREKINDTRPFVINDNLNEFYNFDTKNNSFSFRSNRQYLIDNTVVNSQIFLFGELPLLKIGDIKLASDFGLFQRNLDFLDLDGIELYDDTMMYSGLDIFYSSVRNFEINNCKVQFFSFNNCFCSNLTIKNSSIYKFDIVNCSMNDGIFGFTIEKSKMDKFSITNTWLENIWMSDTQVKGFKYIPQKYIHKYNQTYNIRTIYENIKTLRLAFESSRNEILASKYYYLEKQYKRKCFKTFVDDIGIKRQYGGPYTRIALNFLKKEYTFKNSCMYMGWLSQYYFELVKSSEYRQLIREQLLSYISWVTWGYGEKPLRIILNSLSVMFLFSSIYFFSSNQMLSGNLVNSMYYSVITFTTLGYGDIVPTTDVLKLFSAAEAVLGAFSMGLIVAGYTIKARS